MGKKTENLPMTICPKCGEEVETCDRCGCIIHDDQAKVWTSGAVFCGRCHRRTLGRCDRRRMPK